MRESKTISEFPAPLEWADPRAIVPRKYLLGRCYQLGTVQGVIAPGGTGKSALMIAEALAIASDATWAEERELDFLGYPSADACRVWLWNLEEDEDELRRRFYATAGRHELDPEQFRRVPIFVSSGIDHPLRTSNETLQGSKVDEIEFKRLERSIGDRRIRALIVDPFVSSHGASENDNGVIDALVKRWAKLAKDCNISVTLVHHTRKLGGEAADAESARGAKAFIDACRHVRVLNKMTEQEAKRAGLDDRRGYFRVDDAKANYSRPERSRWFRIEGAPLGNGDDVGVIVPWQWPDAFDGLTSADLLRVQRALNGKNTRKDMQAKAWAGHIVGQVLGIDTSNKAGKQQVKQLIAGWLESGALVIEGIKDDSRQERPCIAVGEWANEE